MSEIVRHQQAEVMERLQRTDIFGRPKFSRQTEKRLLEQLDETWISQFKITRAELLAMYGMLAEDRIRRVGPALLGNEPEEQLTVADYRNAIHAVAVSQILKAGN